jgi:1-acyl-sn-glycerol-3-phosphate acyltransferase
MVGKVEIFRIPLWGQALKACGCISIDRKNRTSAIESLKAAATRMKAGTSIWISPEGTRSRTGELAEFKKGGFIMAIETGATIVPVTITGTFGILPPKTSGVRLGRTITVRFHPPIDASAYTLENKEALMADVRAAIAGEP